MKTQIKSLIIDGLTMHKWVHRKELLGYVNSFLKQKDQIRDSHMRRIIAEMIEKDRILIISSTKGYSIVGSDADFNDYVVYLKSKIRGLNKRLKKSMRNWAEKKTRNQKKLNFDQKK